MVPSESDIQDDSVYIIVTRSLSRQLALKALLSVLLKDIPVKIAEDYTSARLLVLKNRQVKALVVIDDWSLPDDPGAGISILRGISSLVRCVILIESSKLALAPVSYEADAILVGDFSGNQFLETVQKLINRKRE